MCAGSTCRSSSAVVVGGSPAREQTTAEPIDNLVATLQQNIKATVSRIPKAGEATVESIFRNSVAVLSKAILQPREPLFRDVGEFIISRVGELWNVSWNPCYCLPAAVAARQLLPGTMRQMRRLARNLLWSLSPLQTGSIAIFVIPSTLIVWDIFDYALADTSDDSFARFCSTCDYQLNAR